MILMNAGLELPSPKSTAPKLVEIPTLIHQHIAGQNGIPPDILCADFQLTHVREIKVPILNICNAQIVDYHRVIYIDSAILRDTGPDGSQILQMTNLPIYWQWSNVGILIEAPFVCPIDGSSLSHFHANPIFSRC